jgi:hypothetical protein
MRGAWTKILLSQLTRSFSSGGLDSAARASIERLAFSHKVIFDFISRFKLYLMFYFPDPETITFVMGPKVCRDSCRLGLFDVDEESVASFLQGYGGSFWTNYICTILGRPSWNASGVSIHLSMYDELDQLREQHQSCTEQKWNWAEKHKELKRPGLQL